MNDNDLSNMGAFKSLSERLSRLERTFTMHQFADVNVLDALAGVKNGLEIMMRKVDNLDKAIRQALPDYAAKTEEHCSILTDDIGSLNLSTRSSNCLRAENITTIGELIGRSERDLLHIPNFGRRSLNEVKELLARHGLSLWQ